MAQRRPDRVLGPPDVEFWAWCDKGELRLQRCGRCHPLSWPAVDECEYCGSTELSWDRLSGRGKLVSWCTFEHDYYRGMLPIPYDTILVDLDEGALLISNPVGFSWKDMQAGLPVKLTFLDCE